MFGDVLRNLRTERKLSQKQLADILELSKSTISMYELNLREPSFEIMEAIADLFNVDMDYLYGKTDIRNKYRHELQQQSPAPSDDPTFITLAHKLRKLDPENLKKVDKALTALFPEDFE